MLDEFDDQPIPASAITVRSAGALDSTGGGTRVAKLVCRLYRAATPALRSSLLACLVKPLGTLGTVGIAAGAFGVLLHRSGSEGARAAMDDVARFSNDQVIELARFVEQVSPDALQEAARMFAEQPMGVAAFSVSAALLLMRVTRQRAGGERQELVTK